MRKNNFLYLMVFVILCAGLPQEVRSADDRKAGDLKIEPYIFENSKKERVPAEFGRLTVPENRRKAGTRLIEIAFVRFKSTAEKPGPPIIYLAGGPGGSGINSAKYDRFELFMAMRRFGDVIALDQRGVGESRPNLRCLLPVSLPLDQPLTRESLVSVSADNIGRCQASWKKQGVDVSAYNTLESARDLNDLRRALGEDKISLWGISYGTHLGLAALRLFGQHIDRAILAGIEGPDDTFKLPANTEKLIEHLSRRVEADEELSKKVPDLKALIKTVHRGLEKQPVEVEVSGPENGKKTGITLGLFDLQYLLSSYSGSTRALAVLPRLYLEMSRGDFSFLAEQMLRFRRGRTYSLMSVAMDCASGMTAARAKRIGEEKRTALFADAINAPFPEVCPAIDHAVLGDEFRWPVVSDVPVLLISGTLDGRTPVSNAEAAVAGLTDATHLIIEGAGHSDPLFLSSPMIKETMLKFMNDERLPRVIRIETAEPFRFARIN